MGIRRHFKCGAGVTPTAAGVLSADAGSIKDYAVPPAQSQPADPLLQYSSYESLAGASAFTSSAQQKLAHIFIRCRVGENADTRSVACQRRNSRWSSLSPPGRRRCTIIRCRLAGIRHAGSLPRSCLGRPASTLVCLGYVHYRSKHARSQPRSLSGGSALVRSPKHDAVFEARAEASQVITRSGRQPLSDTGRSHRAHTARRRWFSAITVARRRGPFGAVSGTM